MQFRFEDFVLDDVLRELRRDDEVLSVEPQALDLLVYLIRNRDRIVNLDELSGVGDGRLVSGSSLDARINAARAAVDDDGEDQRLIQILPQGGYHFIGSVREDLAISIEPTASLAPTSLTTDPHHLGSDSDSRSEASTDPGTISKKPSRRTRRKIAAILASDIAQYSRLVAEDEEETVRRLTSLRNVIEDFIVRDSGRVFSIAGDAIFAEFPSAVEAVRCAIDIQESVHARNLAYPPSRHMNLRIGITIGDVIEQDGALIGDGVNIAARLEGIADTGGICVSRGVYEQVVNKLSVRFADIGEQQVKNIPTPVHVFKVQMRQVEFDPPPPSKALVSARQAETVLPPRPAPAAGRASNLIRYIVVPTLLLLLAHYLIVLKLDTDLTFLRAATFAIPLLSGCLLVSRAGQGPSIALAVGALIGLLSVMGMLAAVGIIDGRPIIPASLIEWQEAFEYWVIITLSTVLGSIIMRSRLLANLLRTRPLP